MRKNILLLLITFIGINSLLAVNSLRVGDPRNSFSTQVGTIDEASYSIRPKGIYTEIGMYLTFSAQGTTYLAGDSLEVVLKFDLPENAVVTDSWLWIGDTIYRADILDRWTASSIFEGLVMRRTDPSILTKENATQHTLRIFPMRGDQQRKVKITILVPTDWTQKQVLTQLPMSLLKTSKVALPEAKLVVWEDATWFNPIVLGYPNYVFNTEIHPELGANLSTMILNANFNNSLSIAFGSPIQNGVYLSTFESADDKYYHLAVLPSSFVGSGKQNNVAILVDYDVSNTLLSKQEIFDQLKNTLHKRLSPTDSFNVFISGLLIHSVSNTWIPADSISIENAFDGLVNQLSNFSNLNSLLATGISFINTNSNSGGSILLAACSNGYGGISTVSNSFMQSLVASMSTPIAIHIADFQTQNYSSGSINSMQYLGNGYLYSNLANITQGSFNRMLNTGLSLSDLLDVSINETWGRIFAFDLNSDMENGFCYGRYNLSNIGSSAYLNKPLLQVGKFYGDFPFKVTVSGEYDSEIFNNEVAITVAETAQLDSTARQFWVGAYLKSLASQPQSNAIVNEIVETSIGARALSVYTAFLCLEVSEHVCDDCVDEITDVMEDSISTDDVVVSAFPNPFVDVVNFKIELPSDKDLKEASFRVFDMQGKLVKEFSLDELEYGKNNQYTIKWNSSNEGASGMYFCVLRTQNFTKTIKILKM